MKLKKMKQTIGILLIIGVTTVGGGAVTHAIETERPDTSESSTRLGGDESTRDSKREAQREAKDRLTDARLRACQAREKAIKNIGAQAAERGKRHIERFAIIAERVEAFYTRKGKVLPNYDQLVADVAAKKAAAEAAIQATVSSGEDFSCSGDNPKEAAMSFKTTLRSQTEAIKAFKTSVRNLIVGVKSVQGIESSQRDGEQ